MNCELKLILHDYHFEVEAFWKEIDYSQLLLLTFFECKCHSISGIYGNYIPLTRSYSRLQYDFDITISIEVYVSLWWRHHRIILFLNDNSPYFPFQSLFIKLLVNRFIITRSHLESEPKWKQNTRTIFSQFPLNWQKSFVLMKIT